MPALEWISPDLARWIAETTVVAAALALLASLASRRRGLSPAARHLLWLTVLIKLMTPSLAHWPWSVSLAGHSPGRVGQFPGEIGPTPSARASPEILDAEARPVAEPGLGATILRQGPGTRPVESPHEPTNLELVKRTLAGALLPAWLVGSVGVGLTQALRIARFSRSIRRTKAAPPWLIEETERIGGLLSVRVPSIRVVDRLATPILWCLGSPVLLVPGDFLASLERGRWRGILAHELAHVRRGDPWVVRLDLLASIVWWWNPLYWLARRRIDGEAELACDAWVARLLPDERIEYAESLVRIATCSHPSRLAMPTLGIAGAGKTLERRLIMILREPTPSPLNPAGLLAAFLLAALAAPSWTFADPARPAVVPPASEARPAARGPVDLPTIDDDDDDEDDKKKADADKAAKDARRKAIEEAKAKGGEVDAELGRRLEAIGEEIAREMEKKFGADFERKMEAIGKDIEAKFGPEFEKQMEKMGEELAKKFGPDSDFAREMKLLGERVAKQVGPDLEGDEPGAAKAREKAKIAKEKAEVARQKADAGKAKAVRPKVARSADAAKAKPDEKSKARRIEALESRIESLKQELESLKADQDKDKDEEADDN